MQTNLSAPLLNFMIKHGVPIAMTQWKNMFKLRKALTYMEKSLGVK